MERVKLPKVKGIDIEAPNNISKWIPLLCAAAAAGVSIVALKEIKNVRAELSTIKKDSLGDDINKRMIAMESQLNGLSEFIKAKTDIPPDHVIKQAVKKPNNVTIINNEEYEEVEVTDDDEI
jgi:hypothetical protein